MSQRIIVEGTGSQAPYGIGEYIKSFANTAAGLKKAQKFASLWYNEPRIIIPQKITQKDIVFYRKMAKKDWHDKDWHEYMTTPKATAIKYAIFNKEPGDTDTDLAKKAMSFLDTVF